MIKKNIILIAFSFLVISVSFSQNDWKIYNHTNTPSIGPISYLIYDIEQDANGILWFGSDAGLSSFDGNQWEYSFDTGIGQFGVYIANNYYDIIFDNDGVLWHCTPSVFGGLYNLSNNVFSVISTGIFFYNMEVDSSNTLWLAAYQGLYKYENDSLQKYSEENEDLNKCIYDVHIDKENNLWLSAEGKLLKYNGEQWNSFEELNTFNINAVFLIKNDTDNNIYIITDKGLFKKENDIWCKIEISELDGKRITDFLIDYNDDIWISTKENGIIYFNGILTQIYDKTNYLSDNCVLSLFEDKDQKIWVGYFFAGIDVFNRETWENFSGNNILNPITIFVDDNAIWIGTFSGGFSIYDGTNWETHNLANGFISNRVRKIMKDDNGNYWIATLNGLAKYDGNSFTYYTVNEGLPVQNVMSLLVDNMNNIWIGCIGGGAAKFDGEHWTYFNSTNSPLKSDVRDIMQDSDANIWFISSSVYGTQDDIVCKYDGQNWETFTPIEKGYSSRIIQDKDGNIWVVYFYTDQYSIAKYDGTDWELISIPDSVSMDKCVYTIYEDNEGLLWFGLGEEDVITFDGESWQVFTHEDGFPWSGVRDIVQDNDNNFWFATDYEGVFKWVLYPDEIKEKIVNQDIIKVYPNPFGNEINLQINQTIEGNVQIEIFDIQGKILSTINKSASNHIKLTNTEMNIIDNGIYFIKVIFGNTIETIRINHIRIID